MPAQGFAPILGRSEKQNAMVYFLDCRRRFGIDGRIWFDPIYYGDFTSQSSISSNISQWLTINFILFQCY